MSAFHNMGKILMVVAPKDYQDIEFEVPRNAFLAAGHEVDVCSRGDVDMAEGVLGGGTKVDADIASVETQPYDAIVFVGGGGASVYFNDENAHRVISEASDAGKVVAAICIAPSTLANAGVLKSKKATSFPSEEGNLTVRGAEYTGGQVEVTDNIVTANGPAAAPAFASAIMKLLSCSPEE